jgi:hypothetical protein
MYGAHRPTWRRHLATALVGAIAAVTQLGGSLHYVLVEHVHCAEHGEIAHGGHPHAADDRDEDRTASEIEVAAGGTSDAAHEHCSVAVERREGVALASAGEALLLAPADEPVGEPVTDLHAPRIALYLLAPKSSPPV